MTDRDSATLTRYGHQPNIPEVSGTSFPLLTTVLAGFAVTIAVQLILRPDAESELPLRAFLAILAFLASTLVFISSIIFSVNAQGHNYLPFLQLEEDARRTLGIDSHRGFLLEQERRWVIYHHSAIATFYGGIALLLAGVNLIVWLFVGGWIALLVLAIIIFNLLMTVSVSLWAEHGRSGVMGPQQREHAINNQ